MSGRRIPFNPRITRQWIDHVTPSALGGMLVLLALLCSCTPSDTPIITAGSDTLGIPLPELQHAIGNEDNSGYAIAQALAWEPGPPADLNAIGAGECLWRRGEDLIPLPMLSTDVTLQVTGLLVHGRVQQTFSNPGDDVIEAVYVFPLPERAAVNALEMRIGDRLIVAELHEKDKARQVYTQAKREGRKAALLESERPNLFTTSVANINPGETVAVTLDYIQELDYNAGVFSLAFPLTFTPRYTPPPLVAQDGRLSPAIIETLIDAARVSPGFRVDADAPVPTAHLTVNLNAGLPLAGIESRSHEMNIEQDERRWTITPAAGELAADRDFLLCWRPALGGDPAPVVFMEERDGERYALLMLLPPVEDTEESALPSSTLFVVDISGSMDGPSISQARRALMAALDRLGPDDRFNLMAFNDLHYTFSDSFRIATPLQIRSARDWVAALEATGGTEIKPALDRAVHLTRQVADEETRVCRLILLTDAAVSNESAVLKMLARNLGATRLHVVGIGHAPNRYLMRKMASLGHGLCTFVPGDGEVESAMGDFLIRVGKPAMSRLRLAWRGIEATAVYPRRLPDLHAGEPLFISARLQGEPAADAEVVLTGLLPRGEVHTSLPLSRPVGSGSGVAARWARTRVGSLMDSLHEGADPTRVRAAVIDVAREFNLVTKYTSLVAVEKTPSALLMAQRRNVPNTLPRGSRLGNLPSGGTTRPLRILLGGLLCLTGLLPRVLHRSGGLS
ncbi:MAG: marine proteobacterial sortase target protein [bacterium]|nr:marine proteobacterial sortase target protein [bacterium]